MIYRKLLITTLLVFFGSCAFSQFTVIANASVSVSELDADFLKKVYLGKKSRWEDGSKIEPLMLGKGETHKAFLDRVVNKTPSQFNTFWKKMIFTGKGAPPKSFKSMEALLAYVKENEGAVAYYEGDPPSGVKVIQLVD